MSTPRTLLLCDDDTRFRERLAKALAARAYEVLAAAGHEQALQLARERNIERAIVDLKMPGPGGLVLIRDLLALQPGIELVVLTGYGSIATAVEAMRLGARDYLT
ncbi:MAG TPA: response regulator, partial [Polyangiaceae bacterium]|nr:response regulator [Polyangiaceae bacterium]